MVVSTKKVAGQWMIRPTLSCIPSDNCITLTYILINNLIAFSYIPFNISSCGWRWSCISLPRRMQVHVWLHFLASSSLIVTHWPISFIMIKSQWAVSHLMLNFLYMELYLSIRMQVHVWLHYSASPLIIVSHWPISLMISSHWVASCSLFLYMVSDETASLCQEGCRSIFDYVALISFWSTSSSIIVLITSSCFPFDISLHGTAFLYQWRCSSMLNYILL